MKAKDLAALAALGVAGYAAYDKFGKKPAAGKAAPVYDYDTSPAKASPVYDYDDSAPKAELGTRGAYMPDTPEFRTKGAYLDEQAVAQPSRPVSRSPVAVTSPVRTPVVTKSAAPAPEQVVYDNDTPVAMQKPDASRVNAYNPDIMYNNTVKSDPNVVHDDEMNRLARTRATRQGAVVAQSPNAQAQARILRQGPTPAPSATNAQAQARMLRQGTSSAQTAAPVTPAAQAGRYTKDQYGNIIDNTTGKVSRTIFSAGQEGNAANNGMKRGGSVKKMASGGLTSSKMSSKPKQSTASSRGDGIAQRGKTRGMMR